MRLDELQPVQIYCQNCGHKCLGYKSRDGTVRFTCDRCGAITVSRKKNERTVDTRMTAPQGQILLT